MFLKIQDLSGKPMALQLIILLVAIEISPAKELNSTCEVNITGTSGRVECLYSADLKESEQSFLIERYDLTGGSREADRVLKCFWTKLGLKCIVKPSFHFDEKVSTKVILEIPTITKANEGRYSCYGIPSGGQEAKDCTLKINEAGTEQPNRPTTLSVGAVVQNPCEEYILATGILAGSLGTVVIIAVLKYLCTFSKCRGANHSQNPLPEGQPDQPAIPEVQDRLSQRAEEQLLLAQDQAYSPIYNPSHAEKDKPHNAINVNDAIKMKNL